MQLRVQPFSLTDYYLTSVLTGVRSLPGRYPREAAERMVNPLSYPRFMEFQLALRPLSGVQRGRVLDIGERQATDGPTFYQRHYDDDAIQERLIEPSGLRLVNETYFGEPGIRFEKYWNRIPMRWKLPLLWAQPFLAKLFLKPLTRDRLEAACGVALELEKPA